MPNTLKEEELLYFNGINGATGEYGLPPMTGEQLTAFIQGEEKPENLDELKHRREMKEQGTFGVKEGVDPKKLSETGWGIVFAHDADPAIKEALSELIQLRKEQAGGYFKIYEGPEGYRPNETKSKFLSRHGIGPGPVDPEKMPYYLLIVGSPEAIPYQFQYQLDVQYAVGRICFKTAEEYFNYAITVKEVEKGNVKLPRKLSFFGVANEGDRATTLSTDNLITPLFNQLKEEKLDWEITAYVKEAATKAQLVRLLGGEETPALLFTASHGMEFPMGDSRQIPHQGALLCQDWPGPQAWQGRGPILQDFYFTGDDLMDRAKLPGLITFHFACYGAGTPLNDEFSKQAFKERKAIAPHPFVAGLPTRLLSHPHGSALAVVGHVERAWGYSFLWPGAGEQTTVFKSTMDSLLKGNPVGHAIEYFNERYAELASDLTAELEEIEYGKQVNPYDLSGTWTANNDARSYVILGDPAVRLPVAEPGETSTERPIIKLKTTMSKEPETPKEQIPAPKADSTEKPDVPPPQADIEFGLLDMGRGITETLRNVSEKLAELLFVTVDELTSLEIQTYTTEDLRGITYDSKTGRFSEKARLQAMTRISLDGDMQNLIPEPKQSVEEGGVERTSVEIDEKLWAMHCDMVDLAQANKVQFVKALAEVAGTMLKLTK